MRLDEVVILTENRLACDCCGVAVGITDRSMIRQAEGPLQVTSRTREPVLVTRCSSCVSVTEEAAAYLERHPQLAAQMGSIAQERIEGALFALQVLDRAQPSDAVFGAVWPRLWRAESRLRFDARAPVKTPRGSSAPWTHVSPDQRQRLRQAFAAGLQERAALSQAPVTVPCPSGACLFCGVAQTVRPAVDVARLDGLGGASRAFWRPIVTFPIALGGEGSDGVQGHLCLACSKAMDSTGGAVGPSARAQAVVSHVQATQGHDEAQRLSNRLAMDLAPPMPAWAVMKRPPNQCPWEHLEGLLTRL